MSPFDELLCLDGLDGSIVPVPRAVEPVCNQQLKLIMTIGHLSSIYANAAHK